MPASRLAPELSAPHARASRRSTSRRCGRSSGSARRRSSPDGAMACAAVTRYDMDEERQPHRAVAVSDRVRRAARGAAGQAAAAHGRRQGRRSANGRPTAASIAFTAKRKDDEEPQVYRDRARRRRGEARSRASRPARRRSSGLPTASASPSFRGCGRISRPTRCRRSAGRNARTRRSRRTSPSAPNTASGTTGSPTGASRTCSSATSRPAAAATLLAGTGLCAAAVGAVGRGFRHRARRRARSR